MSRVQGRLLEKSKGASKPGAVMAALDIGCSKITCMIARRDVDQPAKFTLLGAGRQQSRGFEGGAITDMEGLERSIRLAVEDAERQAGERIDNVVLGVTGSKLDCHLVSASLPLGSAPVTAKDIKRVETTALAKATVRARHILTAHPVAYRLDDQDGVRDPRGMHGSRLGVLLSVVSAPESLLLNLIECVGRAHLNVEQLVPAAIATGMGTLIDDERDNGAICIDLGAGVTTASVFINGVPAWQAIVPAGGMHVTNDLAQGLGTTFAAAERLKTIHGNTDPEAPGFAERIDCPKLGDDGRLQAHRIERRVLSEIIAPRVEETLEIIRDLMADSQLKKVLPRRGVLTGGGSQIAGLRDTASRMLSMPIRLGRPVSADRLGDVYANPSFSTAAGLLTYKLAPLSAVTHGQAAGDGVAGLATGGAVGKALFWIRENF